jgi:hypothetical protein
MGFWGQIRICGGKYGYLLQGQITSTDFRLLLDMQKRTYCNKICDKFSYFLYPHVINVLLYRMKPRKHIYRYIKYCWQTYFKSIGTLSQTFKNHIVTVAFKWCVPSASGVFLSKNDNSGGKTREASEVVEYDFLFHGIWFLSCVITCSDFYPLSNQINIFMVINIWGIIIIFIYVKHYKRLDQ